MPEVADLPNFDTKPDLPDFGQNLPDFGTTSPPAKRTRLSPNLEQMLLAREVSPEAAQAEQPGGKILEDLQTDVTKALPEPVRKVLTYNPIVETIKAIGEKTKTPALTGVGKGLDNLSEGLRSPIGLATMGIGEAPVAVQRSVSLAFAAQMAAETPDIAAQLGNEFGKPEGERDTAKIAQLMTQAAGTVGFTTLAAKHGLTVETPTPSLAPKTKAVVADTLKNLPEFKEPVPGEQIKSPAIAVAGKVVEGPTHVDAYAKAKETGQPDTSGAKEGFTTDSGRFVTREEAAQISGLPTEVEPGKLHSSDLEKAKEPDPEWQVTVQKPQVPGDKGYIQIDDISGGENKWSKSPETLSKEGYKIPDLSSLPQGKYKLGEAISQLKEPELVGMGGAKAGEVLKPELAQLTDSIKTLAEQSPKQTEVKTAFNLGETAQKIKDGVSESVSGLKSAGSYLKQKLIGKPVVTDYVSALGQRHLELSESADNARKFVQSSTKAVPDEKTQAAISNYIDTGGDPALLDQAISETKAKYKAGYEAAKNLTPEQKVMAQNARNYFASRLQEAIDAGVLEDGIEDYIHRIYETESPWKRGVLAELRSGIFTGRPGLAKQRTFQYDFEAEKAGLKPIKSFIKRIAAYDLSLNKALADRKLVKSMMEIKMPDGRPMIDVGGIGSKIEGPTGETDATLIKPSWKPTDPNTPIKNRGDFKPFDHPALRKWKWASTDAEGKPIFVQGDVLVHPEAIGKVRALFEKSRVRQNPVGRALLGVSSTIKQTMLDLSGFHLTQITVHGWEHRTFKPINEIDFENPDVRGLVKGGVVTGETTGHELFSEGLASSSLTRYIPGIGPKLQAWNEYLFNSYIPRLKMAMALHALERNRVKFPELTPEQQFKLTADEAQAAFGELNYEMMGRSKTTQDMLRLALLAPDFLEARARFAGQAVTKYGGALSGKGEQFQALVGGAAVMYITARIINKLLDGEYHFEPKNAFSVIHKGKAYSLRTVQGDILHAATEPGKFVFSRLNPVYGRTGMEFVTGRDAFGRTRSLPEQAKDFVTTGVPISLRGLLNPNEQTLFESFLNSFGITERRSTSGTTIRQMANDWKAKNKIQQQPGEFVYDPEKDPYRAIHNAATFSTPQDISAEIGKAVEKQNVSPKQIQQHFTRLGTEPFSGSYKNESKFVGSLTEDQKKLYTEAKTEQKEVLKRFREGYALYLKGKKTTPTPTNLPNF